MKRSSIDSRMRAMTSELPIHTTCIPARVEKSKKSSGWPKS